MDIKSTATVNTPVDDSGNTLTVAERDEINRQLLAEDAEGFFLLGYAFLAYGVNADGEYGISLGREIPVNRVEEFAKALEFQAESLKADKAHYAQASEEAWVKSKAVFDTAILADEQKINEG